MNDARRANDLLNNWAREGKLIKAAAYWGSVEILRLLGIKTQYKVTSFSERLSMYNATGSTLYEDILGPHGLTKLKIAIIQAEEREKANGTHYKTTRKKARTKR